MSAESEEDFIAILKKFESMLKTGKEYFFDSSEYEDIIDHYLGEGNKSKAKKAVEYALSQYPDSVPIGLLQAEILIMEEKTVEALLLLDNLQRVDPSNGELYIQKASIYSKLGNHEKSIELLNLALQHVEDLDDIYPFLGLEYLFVENYEDAKQCFVRCVEIDNDDQTAIYNAVHCFEITKDYDGALEFLDNVIEKNPYSEVGWHQLGRIYRKKDRLNDALVCFDFAIISEDTFTGAYMEKGKVLELLGRYNEAIETYSYTLEIDDPTAFAYLRIGDCHKVLGNTLYAIDSYEKALVEDPVMDKAYMALAVIFFEKAEYNKAQYHISRAVAYENEKPTYWRLYAQIHLALDLTEEAIIGYKNIAKLKDAGSEDYEILNTLLIKIGEYQEAEKYLKKGTRAFPSSSLMQYMLGAVLLHNMKPDMAKTTLRKALKMDVKNSHLPQVLFPKLFPKGYLEEFTTIKRAR